MDSRLICSIANGIYRIYSSEKEKSYNPQHLSHNNTLILFQKFKKAYENKDIRGIKDTISDSFNGDIYGSTKSEFINFMTDNFRILHYGLSPYLAIAIYNISSSSDLEFSAVLDMKANLQVLGIPTPIEWDTGKLFCQAKPEGQYNCWKITKLVKFTA